MCIGDQGLLAVGKDLQEVTKESLAALLTEDSEIVTLYYGQDVSAEDAEAMTALLQDAFPDVEVELQYGGQPVYYYFISAE